jgi:osmotically inducible protein OsmC
MVDRTAHVSWSGSLMEGGGTITSVGSGAFGPLDVTWASRAEDPDGRTSPEELLAAAHAACFSMALSHGLAQAGTPPEKLDVDATVTFVPGTGITKIALAVRASVPGIDEPAFLHAAEDARQNCPVSQALASVPEITLAASLAQDR